MGKVSGTHIYGFIYSYQKGEIVNGDKRQYEG